MCWSRWSRSVTLAALCGAWFSACASPQGLGAAGDDCFRIADCKEGLVCVENSCSRDLSRLGSDYDPSPEQPAPTDGAVADGAPSDAPVTPPDMDVAVVPTPDAAGTGGVPGTGGAGADASAPATGGTPATDSGSTPSVDGG